MENLGWNNHIQQHPEKPKPSFWVNPGKPDPRDPCLAAQAGGSGRGWLGIRFPLRLALPPAAAPLRLLPPAPLETPDGASGTHRPRRCLRLGRGSGREQLLPFPNFCLGMLSTARYLFPVVPLSAVCSLLSLFVPDFLHTLDFPIHRFSNDSVRAKAAQSSHSVFLWNSFLSCLAFSLFFPFSVFPSNPEFIPLGSKWLCGVFHKLFPPWGIPAASHPQSSQRDGSFSPFSHGIHKWEFSPLEIAAFPTNIPRPMGN